jgi:HD-GYP domain-containing protein (c-di-GMP phosphodiesterase class II)
MNQLNLEESPLVQKNLQASLERPVRPLTRREWIAEAVVGGGLVAAAVALPVLAPGQRGLDPVVAALLALALALAARVQFDVVGSYTVPAGLVVVPMLFMLPPSAVPLIVVGALALSKLPDVARGLQSPSRIALVPSDSWFAFGPALVLTLAGAPGASDVTAWVLVAALLAQFAFDLVGAATREAINGGMPLREQVHESAWIYSVDALLAPLGFLAALAADPHEWAIVLLLPLLGLLQLFAYERRWRIEYILELSRAYRGTAALLGDVVEADHSYTGDHSRQVVELALAVGEQLHLSPHEQRRVEFGALLHDVGKIAVPKSIIDKPGPLDEDEWEVMRLHTIEGEAMLAKVGGVLGDAGLVVRASHEHYDGSGYPDGLRGHDIPVEARVVSCCDAFSAMTTTRTYRRARNHEAALAELRRCAGTQFDPEVVVALARVVEGGGNDGAGRTRRFERPDGSAAELDQGDVVA